MRSRYSVGAVTKILGEAARGWRKDNAPRLGAALAYYTLFSIAPLLVIAIAVAALVFGKDAAQGRIVAELSALLGEAGARALEETLESSRRPTTGALAALGAFFTLLLGATGVFGELKGSLNVVWDVREDEHPGRSFIVGMLRNRRRPRVRSGATSLSRAPCSPPQTPWPRSRSSRCSSP